MTKENKTNVASVTCCLCADALGLCRGATEVLVGAEGTGEAEAGGN